jgi:GntR family transcriptional regulator/MocR family aminotransferase
MHLVGWLPPGADDADVSRRAAARGVDAIPLSAFAIGRGAGRPGVLLGYANVNRVTMFGAARGLAAAIRESFAQRPARVRHSERSEESQSSR